MEFFYTLNVLIFFRLFFLFRDKDLSLKAAFILTLLQAVPLLIFEISFSLTGFIILLLVVNLLLFFFEKSGNHNFNRFISFLVLIIFTSVFTSEYFSIKFNRPVIEFLKELLSVFPSFTKGIKIDTYKVLVCCSGILILLNEINFLIRYFFEALNLYPEKAGDDKEYNTGRVIGMLERLLIFFFVLVNEITVIGFIIAAKGFTRFKELDKRDFAEYVLIGTLLSTLFSLIISFLIREVILL